MISNGVFERTFNKHFKFTNVSCTMPPNNSNQIRLDENQNAITKLDLATEEIFRRIKDVIEIDANFGHAVYLKCWLTLGKLNIDKTERILRDAMQWRKEKNAEFAITQPRDPFIERSLRVYLDGNSRNGFIIGSAYVGIFKLRETLAKCGVEAGLHHWLQFLGLAEKLCIERAKEVSRRNPNEDIRMLAPVRKNWFILNANHLSYLECVHTGVIQMAVALVKMATSYFPGLEGCIVIVNAGRFLEYALKALRPLLSGSNVDLITFGYHEATWKAFIHEHVDPDQLRTPFGGTIEYNDIHNPDKAYMKL